MQARQAAAGIGIMSEPDLGLELLDQDENVMPADGRHARRRPSSRESEPGRRQVEPRNDAAEQVQAGAAAAERMRTARRPAAELEQISTSATAAMMRIISSA
ncbi:hypothetical protein [Bradyrhizobium quebecense]|uniref:Uncharacterized protein n=2 Tax=Bradyrhizobium quebecense TaxID=2748629 RepID=A0ACD3V9N1_9BRAD|nr:hypothetical protein [Bradyrhizobium quebecense]UGY03125.1 hypothetical protein J4P68_0039785 [Bradyrhizobium quebecense]